MSATPRHRDRTPGHVRRTTAGIALVGWVVGVPVLFVRWGGWPLDNAPGMEALTWQPLRATASMLLWGLWGQLAWSVCVEVVAWARRRERDDSEVAGIESRDVLHRFAALLTRGVLPHPRRAKTTKLRRRRARDDNPTLKQPPRRRRARRGRRGQKPRRVRRLAALLADVDILVRVLGPVEAVRPSSGREAWRWPVVPVRQKGLEALAYLALSDTGVTRHELGQVLFPKGEVSERALYNAIHQIHKAVGNRPAADVAGRHLLLPERIATDHGLLTDLRAQAHDCADPRLRAVLLDEALSLVRGEPFSGVPRSYAWAAPQCADMADEVAAVAAELAQLCLDSGDDRAAADAARQGLAAAPDNTRLRDVLGAVGVEAGVGPP